MNAAVASLADRTYGGVRTAAGFGIAPLVFAEAPPTLLPVLESWKLSRWYGDVDALVLFRNDGRDRPFALQPDGTAVRTETSAFDLPVKYGLRAELGHRTDSARALEGRYLWVGDATARLDLAGGDFSLPYFGPQAAPLRGLDRLDADLLSRVWGVEFGFRQFLKDGTDSPCRVSLMAGFRHLHVEERLDFSYAGDTTGRYDSLAETNMFGGQVGITGEWDGLFEQAPLLDLHADLRIGILSSQRDGRRTLADDTFGLLQTSDNGADTATGLLDVDLELAYNFRPGVQLTAGYNILYAGDVARGTDQLSYDLTNNTPNISGGGDLLLHGLTFGVKIHWGGRADPRCATGCCTPFIVRNSCGPCGL